MSGTPKTDIDSYFDQAKPHIKTLIKNQLKEMGSAKIIMTLWKKPTEMLVDLEDAQGMGVNSGDKGRPSTLKGNQKQAKDSTNLATHENEEDGYIRVEMPFNSLMTEFFEGSDISDLIQRMLAKIKAQTENPKFPEGGFSLDKIMHLFINFHRLVLARGSSYNELPEWIQNEKAVINPKNKDEGCLL